jgi:hypothetical protein
MTLDGAASQYDVDLNKFYRGRTGLTKVLQLEGVQHSYNSSQGSSPFWQSLSGSAGAFERSSCVYSNQNSDQTATAPCFFHENTNSARI